MDNLKNCAIIVAAGKGKRMGGDISKQYLEIGGVPILTRTLWNFQNCDIIDDMVLVTGKDDIEFCEKEIIEKYNVKKVKAIIEGGAERQNSVYNGLCALDSDTDIVLIHDGVRPFLKGEYIEKIIYETQKYESCVLGVKVKDTIKVCDENGIVSETPERNGLWIAQTPQSFKYDLIMEAHKKAIEDNFLGTDDSMLVERIGKKVKMTEGDYDNIKITTVEDLYFGDAIIKKVAK